MTGEVALNEDRKKRCRSCGIILPDSDAGHCGQCGGELAYLGELSLEDHRKLDAGLNTMD